MYSCTNFTNVLIIYLEYRRHSHQRRKAKRLIEIVSVLPDVGNYVILICKIYLRTDSQVEKHYTKVFFLIIIDSIFETMGNFQGDK